MGKMKRLCGGEKKSLMGMKIGEINVSWEWMVGTTSDFFNDVSD